MRLSAAIALAPRLAYRSRDSEVEARALEQLAVWAGRFTPAVSMQPPQGLLLEVQGSLGLFGGAQCMFDMIRRDVADMGWTLATGCAPTVTAAWWLARGGSVSPVLGEDALTAALSPLPLSVVEASAQTFETLTAIGVKTVGDLLKLPRDGAARRFGQALIDQLDRALGRLPEARRFYTPPGHFDAALELGVETSGSEALLFGAKRLLTQLAGYLAGRCGGIQRFSIVLAHEEMPETVTEIGLVTPTRELNQFVTLVRDRLAAIALPAPVYRIRIVADEILALAGETRSLLQDASNPAGDWRQLVNRLRARLGADAVHGLSVQTEHRPELAWQFLSVPKLMTVRTLNPSPRPLPRGEGENGTNSLSRISEMSVTAPGTANKQNPRLTRPLWLLPEPRPLAEAASQPCYQDGPLTLIAGPERIESGWWDGGDIRRDYFVAQTAEQATLWIYRERRQPGGWFLHGIFG